MSNRNEIAELLKRIRAKLEDRIGLGFDGILADIEDALASLQSDERAEEAAKPKPKTLSNAKAGLGKGIPQSVAGQRLDPEFLAETMGRVEEVEPLRFTHDGALAECPCCSSLDVGAAGNTAHCYGCGLSITKFSHQEALDAWNTRAKRIVQPTGRGEKE